MSASNNNSNRKLTSSEIYAVGDLFTDKKAVEVLKQIRKEEVTEEDTKGKRKQNEIFAFVGFAHQDDILGEDSESEDYKEKQGLVRKLVDKGLVIEGFHVPLERANEKKYGDLRIPSSDTKIGKFKITNEGLAVLAILKEDGQEDVIKQNQPDQKAVVESTPKEEKKVTKTSAHKNEFVPAPPAQETNKAKAVAEFKKEVKEELKQ